MNFKPAHLVSGVALASLIVIGSAAGAQAVTPDSGQRAATSAASITSNPVKSQWESSIRWVNKTNIESIRFENARVVTGYFESSSGIADLNGKVLDRNAELWTSIDAPFGGIDHPNAFQVDLVNQQTGTYIETIMVQEFQATDSHFNIEDQWNVVGFQRGSDELAFDYSTDPGFGPLHNTTFFAFTGGSAATPNHPITPSHHSAPNHPSA